MKKLLYISLFFAGMLQANAQHSVSGIVSDHKDSAVANVSVYIPEFEKYDVTKAGGTYLLKNTGIGIVHIQFSKTGYKTIVQTINTADSALVVNVKMMPTTMELEEVVVTSNSASLPDNIPYPVQTLSMGEYRKSGATTLMQGLAMQPGVDRISVGNGIGKPVIRGLSFNRILVQEFGTRIDDQSWDDRHDIGVSDLGVEKVEVVKGPSALVYGADAMGGALVLVDQKPAAAGTLLGEVGLGYHTNTRGLEGDAGIKGASAKGLFYSLRGGYMSHTSYIQGEDEDEQKKNTEAKEFAANSKWNNASMKAILGMSKKWGVSRLTYSYYGQQIGIIEDEGIANPFVSPGEETAEQREREIEAPFQDVTTQIIALENTIITGKSKVNLNLAWQSNDRKEYEPIAGGGKDEKELAFGLKLNTITYDLKWTSDPEKKAGLVIGTQGLFQQNENYGLESLVPDAPSINDIAGYALVRYDLPKVNVLAGIRYDSRFLELESYEPANEENEPTHTIESVFPEAEIEMEKEFSPINGSLGIAWRPVDDLTIKLNGATGFTAPNYAQLGTWGRHEGTYRFEVGNTDFDVEQNVEGDLGVLWESKSFDVHISGFYNMIQNYIYLQNTGLKDTVKEAGTGGTLDILDVYRYVQNDATLSGGEAILDIHPAPVKWLDLRFGYAMMKGELNGGGNVPYIPANKLTGELTLRWKKLKWMYSPYVTFAFSNYAEQKDTAEFELSSESYSLFDVRIGLQLPFAHQLVDVNLAVTNVLNTPYYSHLSLVRYIGVRDMGRNVSIKIRIPFGIKGFNR